MGKVEGAVGLLGILAGWLGPTVLGLVVVGVILLLVFRRDK
ncbi:hypothetical protein [Amycolatopsis sp. NPDC021455]